MGLDHTYLTRSVYSNILLVVDNVGWILLLLKKSAFVSTSQPSRVVHGTHFSFSTNPTIEVIGLSQASIDEHAT
jgi:hypothetical protein